MYCTLTGDGTESATVATSSGQLHVTIEPGGTALKLRATSHSCYAIRCVRPGRIFILGLAGPHLRPMGRAGPGFRPDQQHWCNGTVFQATLRLLNSLPTIWTFRLPTS